MNNIAKWLTTIVAHTINPLKPYFTEEKKCLQYLGLKLGKLAYVYHYFKSKHSTCTSILLAAPSVMAKGQEYKPEEGENMNSFTAW